jgi:hypothetical protein
MDVQNPLSAPVLGVERGHFDLRKAPLEQLEEKTISLIKTNTKISRKDVAIVVLYI